MCYFSCVVLDLGDAVIALKLGEKLLPNYFKGNRIYKGKFHFRGKLHDFKDIFLGDVAFYKKKFSIIHVEKG